MVPLFKITKISATKCEFNYYNFFKLRDNKIGTVSKILGFRKLNSSNKKNIYHHILIKNFSVDHWKKIERMKRMIEDIKKAYDAKAKTFLEAIL